MGFFLEKTWMWWLLSAVLATLITWTLLRRQDRRAAADGADATSGAATSADAVAGPTGRAVPTPARGISLRGARGGELDVAALRAEIETLRARADDAENLRTRVVTLKVDADRTAGLEEEVRLLRLRLEGEDGQVAVLKRRIALLEAEASRVPDLERELARAGRSSSTRTLGQVVQQAAGQPAGGTAGVAVAEAPQPDLEAGRRALGVPVRLDDLQLVEGVGPKIQSLLAADGIRTWADLADAGVDRLRGVLDAAGPRYQMHNPQSWPQQAALLAAGDWDRFVALTARLRPARP